MKKNKSGKKNKNGKIKNSVKTYIFYKLEKFTLYDNEIDFNIFLEKPTIKLIKKIYFIGGEHYSTLYKIFKTNSRSNKIFELSNIELINKFISLEYKIDFE